MKIKKYVLTIIIAVLIFSCKNNSDEINGNLARLNNKSWQLSRIIDSLENINQRTYTEIMSSEVDKNKKLELLEKYINKSESNRKTWIQFQERELVIDSLINNRSQTLDTINRYHLEKCVSRK